MKNLIIIGAGGMGRVFYDMVRESVGYNSEFTIKGYIDNYLPMLDKFENYPPVICTVNDYIPQRDDIFVCSTGGETRRYNIENILYKGGVFPNIIHKTARIGTNVKLGQGNFVGAFTTIAADAKIGDYNFIQSYTIIGHDVKIGSWNRIDSHVMCIGGIKIGDANMIHTSAVLNHNIEVENNSHIGACSFVTRNVDSNTTIFGNPARRLN